MFHEYVVKILDAVRLILGLSEREHARWFQIKGWLRKRDIQWMTDVVMTISNFYYCSCSYIVLLYTCIPYSFVGSGISSGIILQRFPEKDWSDTPFIEGIEWVITLQISFLKALTCWPHIQKSVVLSFIHTFNIY